MAEPMVVTVSSWILYVRAGQEDQAARAVAGDGVVRVRAFPGRLVVTAESETGRLDELHRRFVEHRAIDSAMLVAAFTDEEEETDE